MTEGGGGKGSLRRQLRSPVDCFGTTERQGRWFVSFPRTPAIKPPIPPTHPDDET